MVALFKRLARMLQELLERHLVGGLMQEWGWRLRHIYRRGWAESYQESIAHSHRDQIVAAVAQFGSVSAVLEVGCASGANLIRLRAALPETFLAGVDINREGIRVAKSYFDMENDSYIELMVGKADQLDGVADQSVDVVLTDAVLMFVTPDQIEQVIEEFVRVSRKGVVLNEYFEEGQMKGRFEGGRWIYDFPALVRKVVPQAVITISNSAFTGGLWDECGKLIEVRW